MQSIVYTQVFTKNNAIIAIARLRILLLLFHFIPICITSSHTNVNETMDRNCLILILFHSFSSLKISTKKKM